MKAVPPKNISVVIVEDHAMFREQLAALINKSAEMFVAGEADNIRDGTALIRTVQPSIAIVDVTLKGSNGLELLKDLRAHEVDVPVLMLSMHDESLYAERALRAGAKGYITKHEASVRVIAAIRQVLKGEIYLDRQFMSQMMSRLTSGRAAFEQPIDRLADRELEVYELIGVGLTSREIGARLGLGTTTVDTYRARIKEKLNLENGARLRAEASRWLKERIG
jgi:DNA-binding NarL/FixJ family response regulator